jgi:hypothetical protein
LKCRRQVKENKSSSNSSESHKAGGQTGAKLRCAGELGFYRRREGRIGRGVEAGLPEGRKERIVRRGSKAQDPASW